MRNFLIFMVFCCSLGRADGMNVATRICEITEATTIAVPNIKSLFYTTCLSETSKKSMEKDYQTLAILPENVRNNLFQLQIERERNWNIFGVIMPTISIVAIIVCFVEDSPHAELAAALLGLAFQVVAYGCDYRNWKKQKALEAIVDSKTYHFGTYLFNR
jgi:hypothetical protein